MVKVRGGESCCLHDADPYILLNYQVEFKVRIESKLLTTVLWCLTWQAWLSSYEACRLLGFRVKQPCTLEFFAIFLGSVSSFYGFLLSISDCFPHFLMMELRHIINRKMYGCKCSKNDGFYYTANTAVLQRLSSIYYWCSKPLFLIALCTGRRIPVEEA